MAKNLKNLNRINKNYWQQSIKIIAETVLNMNIVVRNNISGKLKNLTYEIGYYSYANHWHSLKTPRHKNKDMSKSKESIQKWIEKGYEHFALYGPENISINKISKEIGFSRASF